MLFHKKNLRSWLSGIAAVIEGKSASEVLAATLGGAVDGLLCGVPVGETFVVLKSVLLNTAGGGLGDLTEQYINLAFGNQEECDPQRVFVSSAIGGATGVGSELTAKGIKNLGDKAIKSDVTKRQMKKMFKTEAKNQGKKIKNKELSKKISDRTKEMLEVNKDMEKFNSIAANSIIDFNNEIYGDDR